MYIQKYRLFDDLIDILEGKTFVASMTKFCKTFRGGLLYFSWKFQGRCYTMLNSSSGNEAWFWKVNFFDFLFTMSNSYRCILSWKPWKVNLRQFLLLYLASGSISYGESKCLISVAKIIEGIRVHQTMKFVLLKLL